MESNTAVLKNEAKEILLKNRRDGFTVPSEKLYPFQWNWDSGFAALGFKNFNLEYAIEEIRSMFSGQWQNGMIAHINFHSENETTYFPNFEFWDTQVNSGASQKPKTGGITQPPVFGFVLEEMAKTHGNDPVFKEFVSEIFSKITHFHRFLYTIRDPKNEGLAFIFHPWESGRDNSPLWDYAYDGFEVKPGDIPAYTRKDNTQADPSHRPLQKDYDRFVYLIELGKKHQYDGIGIFEESPFLVQDTLFNALLIKSNDGLINVGKQYGLDVTEIEAWQQKAKPAFENKLWCEEIGNYVCYDLRHNKQIKQWEIGGYTSLIAGIPSPDKAQLLLETLVEFKEKDLFVCPSFHTDNEKFDPKRYWRGPVWPQMNWLIYHGLLRYGFNEMADVTKNDIIALVEYYGFYEYFNPFKSVQSTESKGYGGHSFTWTAAVILDLIENA